MNTFDFYASFAMGGLQLGSNSSYTKVGEKILIVRLNAWSKETSERQCEVYLKLINASVRIYA